jgi:hypothetical protein
MPRQDRPVTIQERNSIELLLGETIRGLSGTEPRPGETIREEVSDDRPPHRDDSGRTLGSRRPATRFVRRAGRSVLHDGPGKLEQS